MRSVRRRRVRAAGLVALVLGAMTVAAAAQDRSAPSDESEAVRRSRAAGLGRTDVSGDLPPDRLGTLGAMSMEAQQRQLAALRPVPSPAGLDREILAFLVPDDNALTADRIALGRRLYFEPRLSADGTVACATCHDVSRGFTDQRPTSVGIRGQLGQRNAPTVMNALLMETQFLDGRSKDLEAQARLPIVNPIEMGQPDGATALRAIEDDPEYQRLFQAAYGRPPNYDDAARAIAAFERTLVFLDSPFQRFVKGDEEALDARARRGWVLYNGKARCVSCHPLNPSNPIGSDGRFHNIGVAARSADFEALAREALVALEGKEGVEAVDELALQTNLSELGRFMVTKDRADIGAFKTLQVTNVGVTAPYMHDGSMRTLWDVIDHYNKGGEANPFLDGGIEPLGLTEDEIDDLVAFLFTLTDDRLAEDNRREEAAQRRIAKEQGERPFRDPRLAEGELILFEERVAGPGGLEGKE